MFKYRIETCFNRKFHNGKLQLLPFRRKQKIKNVDEKAPTEMKQFIIQARDKGASSWLNAMPIEELDFQLNKEEFSAIMDNKCVARARTHI